VKLLEFKKENLIKSPLNYTGGKFKLLPKILPLFPDNIDSFVDLFCGGLNVSINVNAKRIVANDIEPHVIDFYENIKNISGEMANNKIKTLVEQYSLSKTNQEGFLSLRNDYNVNKSWDKFYALISHAFNNQIRYNRAGGYNMPFGKDRSSYNESLQAKLVKFTNTINEKYEFLNKDFREINLECDSSYFFYADPPYLISTATYNENGGWTDKEEIDLLNYLDSLNTVGSKFALSNVLEHKGRSNNILKEWSKKYKVHYLDYEYKNCSYQGKNTKEPTVEVLIINY
jgi:DNA adenine methylase Dam